MTKQHFKAFADEIRTSDADLATRTRMAQMVADVARRFNSNFDFDSFVAACGLTDDSEVGQAARKMWS